MAAARAGEVRWVIAGGLCAVCPVHGLAGAADQGPGLGFWTLFLPQARRGVSLMAILTAARLLAPDILALQQLKNAAGLDNLLRNIRH